MGSEEANDRLLAAMRASAEQVRAVGPFRQVLVDTLREDWAEARSEARTRIRDVVANASRDGAALVVPFQLAGFGPYAEVLEGLHYVANERGLLPDPRIGEWIVMTAEREAHLAGWLETKTVARSLVSQ